MKKTKIIEYDASLDPSQIFGQGFNGGGSVGGWSIDDMLVKVTNNDGKLYRASEEDLYILVTPKEVYANYQIPSEGPIADAATAMLSEAYKKTPLSDLVRSVMDYYYENTNMNFYAPCVSLIETKSEVQSICLINEQIAADTEDFLEDFVEVPNDSVEFTAWCMPVEVSMFIESPASTMSLRNKSNIFKLKK